MDDPSDTGRTAVETTPDLLLALLAIQIHGGEGVPDSTPSINALKKLVEEAKKKGFLRLESHKEAHPTKTTRAGKPSIVTVKRYSLTPEGRQRLRDTQDPLIRAADRSATLRSIREGLSGEIEAMKRELLGRLDTGIAAIQKRLDDSVGDFAFGSGEQPERTGDSGEHSLRSAIATAYRELCHRVEFEDGLIDFSRLYHKTRQAVPELGIDRFKEELVRLRDQDGLQLGPINEVHRLSESERSMAIPHDDSLLYYAYWPEERPR